jgi:hypothetical protein
MPNNELAPTLLVFRILGEWREVHIIPDSQEFTPSWISKSNRDQTDIQN